MATINMGTHSLNVDDATPNTQSRNRDEEYEEFRRWKARREAELSAEKERAEARRIARAVYAEQARRTNRAMGRAVEAAVKAGLLTAAVAFLATLTADVGKEE
jgi:hypothetical protein